MLGTLHELVSDGERASAFRQGMASLALAALDPAAVPFEGLSSEPLMASVRAMIAHQLLDDLGFLQPSAAASALYALASALPAASPERRELGRRVLQRLTHGDAQSFVSLATALALGSTRAFDGAAMRARIELMLLLPDSAGVSVDPLAFALLSRGELGTRLVRDAASSDLPARRMAARLLERAARHAALRARQGDDGELSRFEVPYVQESFALLLADREPWVFRHAASARGLLAGFVTRHADDLERDLMATHTVSRVRRGAISLAAKVAVLPGEALSRARELLRGPLIERDPGLAAALIAGLTRAIEVEPEAGELLLSEALRAGGALAAEALLELRRELQRDDDCTRFSELALQRLTPDEVTDASQQELVAHLCEELARAPGAQREHGPSLPQLVDDALAMHAQEGPAAALAAAQRALAVAADQIARLAVVQDDHGRRARRELLRLMSELDRGLLASSALFSIVSASDKAAEGCAQLSEQLVRLLDLLIEREGAPHVQPGDVPHLALRMRRLRLWLHLIDYDFRIHDEGLPALRERQVHAVRVLFARAAEDVPSAMDRMVHATLSRGLEALVRSETFELADALLCSASALTRAECLAALAEGCLLPDLKRALAALSSLARALEGNSGSRALLHALGELAHAIPSDAGPRSEALRRALLALSRSLEALAAARSIRQLVRSRRALTLFEGAVVELAYLARGARRRLVMPQAGPVIDESPLASLARALESAAVQGEPSDLGPTVEWLECELTRTLPRTLALALAALIEPVRGWPLDADAPMDELGAQRLLAPASAEACPLPAWMPPSRRLGAFSVVRPLGTGLGSSVFLVRRSEQRNDPGARGLALKVPRYDATAARTLSEAAFEAAFARELPALLRVSPNEHLASFVAIEAASRPKPFLVMEWVEGPTLARVRKRQLDALAVLDGVLAGLAALHASGIGHLDVSPARVVLRVRNGELQPVLVDFGLAGREVRAGCGNASYRAPELWGDEAPRAEDAPMAADVYAVACLAYELVTGRPLFHGQSEREIAALHGEHDGAPAALRELAREPKFARLAGWISLGLRADPSRRASASQLRSALKGCAATAAE